ncbi:hypothetical protein K0M31_018577, partial [Melipona bicolor]
TYKDKGWQRCEYRVVRESNTHSGPDRWEFDAAIVTVIVVIISPKCQAGNSKVLIGSCHTMETIRPLQSVPDTIGEGSRAANRGEEQ